jgi:hypothetical protein
MTTFRLWTTSVGKKHNKICCPEGLWEKYSAVPKNKNKNSILVFQLDVCVLVSSYILPTQKWKQVVSLSFCFIYVGFILYFS